MSIVLEAFERLYPEASWEDCDQLLWLTPYPVCDAAPVVQRLEELREKYGPNIADAIAGEYAEMDRQFKQYKLDHPEDFA